MGDMTERLVAHQALVPLTFRRQVSHQTQKPPSKFLPTELGIRQRASWRTRSHRRTSDPRRRAGAGGRRRRTGGESLHPPVHGHVVDLDAALGQQLLDIAVGQAVAEVPADRDRDHLPREPEPSERRPLEAWRGSSRPTHPPSFVSQARQPPPGSTRCNRPHRGPTAAPPGHSIQRARTGHVTSASSRSGACHVTLNATDPCTRGRRAGPASSASPDRQHPGSINATAGPAFPADGRRRPPRHRARS